MSSVFVKSSPTLALDFLSRTSEKYRWAYYEWSFSLNSNYQARAYFELLQKLGSSSLGIFTVSLKLDLGLCPRAQTPLAVKLFLSRTDELLTMSLEQLKKSHLLLMSYGSQMNNSDYQVSLNLARYFFDCPGRRAILGSFDFRLFTLDCSALVD